MPQTKVVFYKEDDGTVPVLDWLDGLPTKARDKCIKKIERLKELGHLIRRPEADYLRDNIYELRTQLRNVQYRLLYFFRPERSEGSRSSGHLARNDQKTACSSF